MTALAELVIALIPPALVAVLYSLYGREPRQPAGVNLRAFGAGSLAVIPVVLVVLLVPGPVSVAPESASEFGRMFVLTGLMEETTKLTALAVLAWPPAWSEHPRHSAAAGAAVGFGFGTAETVLASVTGSGLVILRSLLVSPFHALTTATMAVLFGRRATLGPGGIVGGVLLLAALHTGFNIILQTGTPGIVGAAVLALVWTGVLLRYCAMVEG